MIIGGGRISQGALLIAWAGAIGSAGAASPAAARADVPTASTAVAVQQAADTTAAADTMAAADTLAAADTTTIIDATAAADTGLAAGGTAGSPATAGGNAGVQDPLPARLDSLADAIRDLARSQDSISVLLDRVVAAEDTASTLPGDLETTAQEARRFGLRTAIALVLLGLTFLFIRVVTWILDLLAERHATRRLLYKRLVPIIRVLVWAIAAFVIIRGVYALEARTLVAAGAAIGVAVGLASQDIIKNIFGGLMIIMDRPFQVGDKIRVGDTYGEVTAIGLRATRIVTPDDSVVSVPNARVLDGAVSNANSGELDCQVVTDLWLPGWVDARQARQIAYRAAVTSRYVYLRKPVVVIVKDEVRHTFLTHLRVKAYVQDIRYEFLFMSDVTERARAAFVEAGLLPPWHGATAMVRAPGAAPDDDPRSMTGAAP